MARITVSIAGADAERLFKLARAFSQRPLPTKRGFEEADLEYWVARTLKDAGCSFGQVRVIASSGYRQVLLQVATPEDEARIRSFLRP